jgi:DNA mismatch repair ATPase MutS
MDEVGRGTTVKDGLAIAFATVHHLASKNQCRALFATHFHELTDMLGCSKNYKGSHVFENVAFFCTSVDEVEASVVFYYYTNLTQGIGKPFGIFLQRQTRRQP